MSKLSRRDGSRLRRRAPQGEEISNVEEVKNSRDELESRVVKKQESCCLLFGLVQPAQDACVTLRVGA